MATRSTRSPVVYYWTRIWNLNTTYLAIITHSVYYLTYNNDISECALNRALNPVNYFGISRVRVCIINCNYFVNVVEYRLSIAGCVLRVGRKKGEIWMRRNTKRNTNENINIDIVQKLCFRKPRSFRIISWISVRTVPRTTTNCREVLSLRRSGPLDSSDLFSDVRWNEDKSD